MLGGQCPSLGWADRGDRLDQGAGYGLDGGDELQRGGGTQGGTANGTTTMSIRPDIIVDPNVNDFALTGAGIAFAVKDSANGDMRALASNELANTLYNPAINQVGTFSTVNFSTGSTTSQLDNLTVNTLALQNGGGVTSGTPSSYGLLSPAGGLLTVTLNEGGLLAFPATRGSSKAPAVVSNT